MSASALPPEIMEAILCFLPANSLGRFKSVSKTWNSLISHPQFIKKHLQHLQTTKLILESDIKALYSMDTNQLLPYLLNIISEDVDDNHIPATVKVVSFRCKEVLVSRNGLVLAKNENDSIFLINPTTQERYEVPLSPFVPPDGDFSVRYYGFGYDSSTDDYKVIIVSVKCRRLIDEVATDLIDMCVSIYSLCNNSWRQLPNSFPYDHGFCPALPVVVNQNVHWCTNSSNIVAFSFATEEFNVFGLQLFDFFEDKMVEIYKIVDIGGKLGIFFSVGGVYELWVMEDYGVNDSWTRVCCLAFRFHFVDPMCLVEGSNRDIILDAKGSDHVHVFNIDEKGYRIVKIKGGFGAFYVVGTYAESLESPKRILSAP